MALLLAGEAHGGGGVLHQQLMWADRDNGLDWQKESCRMPADYAMLFYKGAMRCAMDRCGGILC
jgi:hypothetical protein